MWVSDIGFGFSVVVVSKFKVVWWRLNLPNFNSSFWFLLNKKIWLWNLDRMIKIERSWACWLSYCTQTRSIWHQLSGLKIPVSNKLTRYLSIHLKTIIKMMVNAVQLFSSRITISNSFMLANKTDWKVKLFNCIVFWVLFCFLFLSKPNDKERKKE